MMEIPRVVAARRRAPPTWTDRPSAGLVDVFFFFSHPSTRPPYIPVGRRTILLFLLCVFFVFFAGLTWHSAGSAKSVKSCVLRRKTPTARGARSTRCTPDTPTSSRPRCAAYHHNDHKTLALRSDSLCVATRTRPPARLVAVEQA